MSRIGRHEQQRTHTQLPRAFLYPSTCSNWFEVSRYGDKDSFTFDRSSEHSQMADHGTTTTGNAPQLARNTAIAAVLVLSGPLVERRLRRGDVEPPVLRPDPSAGRRRSSPGPRQEHGQWPQDWDSSFAGWAQRSAVLGSNRPSCEGSRSSSEFLESVISHVRYRQ